MVFLSLMLFLNHGQQLKFNRTFIKFIKKKISLVFLNQGQQLKFNRKFIKFIKKENIGKSNSEF